MTKDHVLLEKADNLTGAAKEIELLLNKDKIADIISVIPEEWLVDESDNLSPEEIRAAYMEFINTRLSMIHVLVKESEDARNG